MEREREREREKKQEEEKETANDEKETEDHFILCDPCQEFAAEFLCEKRPSVCEAKLQDVACQTQIEDKHPCKIT